MTYSCVNVWCFVLWMYLCGVYYAVGWVYQGDERLVWYVRSCLVLLLPGWWLFNNKSVMKQFFVGSQLYYVSLGIELLGVGCF